MAKLSTARANHVRALLSLRLKFALLAGVTAISPAAVVAQTLADPSAEIASPSAGDQEASSAADDHGAIVVTAQKREQLLQDVPMAIGVVTGRDIERYGVTRLDDIQAAIPGLTMVDIGTGLDVLIIRGISPVGSGLPATGEFIDDVSISNELSGFGAPFPLVDISRVEVLKGPQGTLYGEGSIGGTIKYFTNAPSLAGSLNGIAEASGSTVDGGGQGYRFTLASDLPIRSEAFGVRLAGFFDREPGWVDNSFSGDNANVVERWLIRGRARARPTEGLLFDLSYQHSERKQLASPLSKTDYTSNAFTGRPARDVLDLVGLNAEWDWGGAKLSSVTGYQHRKIDGTTDLSSYLAFVETFFPGTTILAPAFGNPTTVPKPISALAFQADYTLKTFTQELRLSGQIGENLSYLVGGFYKDSSYTAPQRTVTFPDPNVLPIQIIGGNLNSGTESGAVFGELTWRVLPRLELIGGARYYRDRRVTDQVYVSFGVPSPIDEEITNSSVVPRFVIKYDLSDNAMIYASMGQGFRSGGLQFLDLSAFNIPNSYEPEKLTSFEIGSKGSFANGALRYEAAIYRSDYKDMQVFIPNPFGLQAFGNAGKSTIEGFEISAGWRPVRNLTFQGAFGYNDTRIKDGGLTKSAGDPLDFVPKKTYSFGAEYSTTVGTNMNGRARIDYFHQDKRPFIIRNFGYPSPVTYFDAVDQVNVRAGLDFASSSFEVFVENLLNRDSQVTKPVGTLSEGILQKPRTIGATLRTSF